MAAESVKAKANHEKIRVNETIKIMNPLNRSTLSQYEGPIGPDFNFRQQANNRQLLEATLPEPLTYIWWAEDQRKWIRHSSEAGYQKYYHFVARDDSGQVYWRKYEGPSPGSGYNHVYIKGNRMKLTTWLSKTDEYFN